MLGAHSVHAGIGEADRVDHAAPEFRNAWSPRSVPPLYAHRLGDETAERVEVDHGGNLAPIGGGSGGQQHRILKVDSRDCDSERG